MTVSGEVITSDPEPSADSTQNEIQEGDNYKINHIYNNLSYAIENWYFLQIRWITHCNSPCEKEIYIFDQNIHPESLTY